VKKLSISAEERKTNGLTAYSRIIGISAVPETIDAILGVVALYKLLTDPAFIESMEQIRQIRLVDTQLSLNIRI
jgi:hypothetical protein